MQATSNAGTLERLVLGVLQTSGHQTGHLLLGEVDLPAPEGGQVDVGDLFITVSLTILKSSWLGRSSLELGRANDEP